jgi:hypothetical protein
MKKVSLLDKLLTGGLLLLGTFIVSKVLQFYILSYFNLPFFINPIFGDMETPDNFAYIFGDFVLFGVVYYLLKQCIWIYEKYSKR